MKPEAASGIRGPFQPIRTNVPGLDICELLPRLSRTADRYAVLRSLHHERAEHDQPENGRHGTSEAEDPILRRGGGPRNLGMRHARAD